MVITEIGLTKEENTNVRERYKCKKDKYKCKICKGEIR